MAMLATPWTAVAAPVHEDVAWLADVAGLDVGALPASVPMAETVFEGGVFVERTVDLPIAALAGAARELWEPGVQAEKQFAGAGVRSAEAGTRGVRWSAFIIGSASNTPCITITVQQDLGDPAGLGRGRAMVGVHGETPGGRGSASATMDVQALPNPGPGTPVATTSADAHLAAGGISRLCITIFSIRISIASFFGDGVIYADGP